MHTKVHMVYIDMSIVSKTFFPNDLPSYFGVTFLPNEEVKNC